jgi:hypothetical protein
MGMLLISGTCVPSPDHGCHGISLARCLGQNPIEVNLCSFHVILKSQDNVLRSIIGYLQWTFQSFWDGSHVNYICQGFPLPRCSLWNDPGRKPDECREISWIFGKGWNVAWIWQYAMIPVHVAKLQRTAMTHSLSWLRRCCSLPDSGPWPRGLQK